MNEAGFDALASKEEECYEGTNDVRSVRPIVAGWENGSALITTD